MKKLTRILAVLMSVLILAYSTGAFVLGAEKKTAGSSSLSDEKKDTNINSNIVKEETVYIVAGSDGSEKNIIVSDWLNNNGGLDIINDKSDLSDIENVKGDETFSESNGNVKWSAKGSDIYYKGTTEKKPPVTVKVSYKLDGKDISPEELEGKSGKVTIRYDYTNTQKVSIKNGKNEREIFVPFMMLSAAVLDSEKFDNVEVTNGKLISDGERLIVTGASLPGLKESLGLDKKESDINIPEYFEFTADVKSFSIGTSITIATNELFSEINMNDVDNLDKLDDKIDEITKAADKLADGTSELYDGIKKLSDGSSSLTDGIDQLTDGSSELNSGAAELADGASELIGGAGTLTEGIHSASSGSKDLAEGASALSDGFSPIMEGASALTDGVSSVLDGSKQVESGAKALTDGASELESGSESLYKSSQQLYDGISAAKDGSSQLKEGVENTIAGAEQLNDGAVSLAEGAEGLSAGISEAGQSLDETIEYNRQVLAGLEAIYQQDPDESIAQMIATLQQTIVGQEQISASMKAGGAIKDGASALSGGAEELRDGVSAISDGAAALYDGAESLDSGLKELKDGGQRLAAGSKTLHESISSLSDGAEELFDGTSALSAANQSLKDGAKQLKDGVGSAAGGADSLASGANSLYGGLSKLENGSSSLSEGASTIYTSITALRDGLYSLLSGSSSLEDGVSALKSGSSELVDGISKLEDGSKELDEGMKKFKKEGTDKIKDFYKDDFKEFIDRLKYLSDVSKSYSSFSDIGNNMEGNVKFIYTIEGIGE